MRRCARRVTGPAGRRPEPLADEVAHRVAERLRPAVEEVARAGSGAAPGGGPTSSGSGSSEPGSASTSRYARNSCG